MSTETQTPLLFDRQVCTRCGGTGRYSFNQIDGDRCYGCSGSGQQITRKQRDMYNVWVKARREAREPTYGQLKAGDQIARGPKGARYWATVQSVQIDREQVMGRSRTGGESAEWIDTAWACVVRYTDGDLESAHTGALCRRRTTTTTVLSLVTDPATRAHVEARLAALQEAS